MVEARHGDTGEAVAVPAGPQRLSRGHYGTQQSGHVNGSQAVVVCHYGGKAPCPTHALFERKSDGQMRSGVLWSHPLRRRGVATENIEALQDNSHKRVPGLSEGKMIQFHAASPDQGITWLTYRHRNVDLSNAD